MVEIIKNNKNKLIIFILLVIFSCISMLLIRQNANAQIFGSANSGLPKIQSIRSDFKNNITELTIRSDKNLEYRIFSISEPSPRLVIDFNKLDWSFNKNRAGVLAGTGVINQIRFAHKSETQSRIVLDLKTPVSIVSQKLEGGNNNKLLKIAISGSNYQNFAQINSKSPKAQPITKQAIPPSNKRFTIVIDAGHGGNDPGALGFTKGVFEKQITLASSLTLARILERNPKYRVVLTRNNDSFLSLEKRIVIARDQKADLFISLHADAAPANSGAHGATVYTLSESGGDRSRKLLQRDNWNTNAQASAKDNVVSEILKDLTHRDTKNQSAIFAEILLNNLRPVGPLTSSSHRRAGFFVLLSPTVPAVLFEMGFVTDERDEKRLLNSNFRNGQMAAVAKSIDAYFNRPNISNNK